MSVNTPIIITQQELDVKIDNENIKYSRYYNSNEHIYDFNDIVKCVFENYRCTMLYI